MSDLTSIESIRLAAEFGDPEAQYLFGAAYEDGKGVEKNDRLAFEWYRKAAEQGDVCSQFTVGVAYEDGIGVEENKYLAVKWYRKAAAQGDADAQYNLGWAYHHGQGVDQNFTTAIAWFRKAAKQGAPDAIEMIKELENMTLDQRIQLRKRKDNNRRCPELLDACTPEIYRNNPFRITGLTVDTVPSKIKRRIDDLKDVEALGEAEDEHGHAYALNPPPSLELITTAAQELKDPRKRMIQEFFWFWPEQWGDGQRDPALSALQQNDKESAYSMWREALAQNQKYSSLVAKHNLAVMYQLAALDSEREALTGDIEAYQQVKLQKYWRTCFKWWEELTEDEDFWSLVTERIRMIDDPRLTTGFARRMRGTLPEALDKINALQSIAFIERGKIELAEQHIEYMLETHEGQDDVVGTMALVAEPLFKRLRVAIDHAEKSSKGASSSAHTAAVNLLHMANEPIRILKRFLPEKDPQLTDICDAIADACLNCVRSILQDFKKTEMQCSQAIALVEKAVPFANSESVIAELKQSREDAEYGKILSNPKVKRVANLSERALSESLKNQLYILGQEVEGELGGLYSEFGGQSIEYQTAADLVAGAIRGISVELINRGQENFEKLIREIERFKQDPYGINLEYHRFHAKDGTRGYMADASNLFGGDPQDRALELENNRWDCLIKLAVGLDLYDRGKKIACSLELNKLFESDSQALHSVREICNQFDEELYAKRKEKALLFSWGAELPPAPVTRAIPKSSPPSNGGCFLATAVYGSYDHPSVLVLRRFRDETLMQSPTGRFLVSFYYRIGPVLAQSIGRNTLAVLYVRKVLNVFVDKIQNLPPKNPPPETSP